MDLSSPHMSRLEHMGSFVLSSCKVPERFSAHPLIFDQGIGYCSKYDTRFDCLHALFTDFTNPLIGNYSASFCIQLLSMPVFPCCPI